MNHHANCIGKESNLRTQTFLGTKSNMQLGAMPIFKSSDIDERIVVKKMGEVTAGDLEWKNSIDDRIKSLEKKNLLLMLGVIVFFVILLGKK